MSLKETKVYYVSITTANSYLSKANNRNTRARCVICSKLTIKTPEWCQCYHSGVLIVHFECISHLDLALLLLTFEQVNVGRVDTCIIECGFFEGHNLPLCFLWSSLLTICKSFSRFHFNNGLHYIWSSINCLCWFGHTV